MTTRVIEFLIVAVVVLTLGFIAAAAIAHQQEVRDVCAPRCAPHPVRYLRGDGICVCDMRTEYR